MITTYWIYSEHGRFTGNIQVIERKLRGKVDLNKPSNDVSHFRLDTDEETSFGVDGRWVFV